MKILFFDALFPQGHKSINNRYLELMLKLNAEIFVCSEEDWFLNRDNLHIVHKPWIKPGEKTKNKIEYRKKILKNFNLLKDAIREINPDIIYIASYDIISFGISFLSLIKYKNITYLQEHNNVDQLKNKIKFVIYSIYKNLFNHLVLEEFIRDRLIDLGVHPSKVYVVPLPLPKPFGKLKNLKVKNLCIGLSNSNCEEIIEKIVNCQKKEKFLCDSKFNIILKSKTLNYQDENLQVTSGWISDEEYKRWSCECKYFIIPFSKSDFSYRVSNVFFEAISNNKQVISSSFLLSEYYKKKYPGLCKIFNSPNELGLLLNDEMDNNYDAARTMFIQDHSDNAIVEALLKVFIDSHHHNFE